MKLFDEENKEIVEEMEDIRYKAAVDPLMYAIVATRVDLAFLVRMVSHFMPKVGMAHWMAMKCIFRYLKGTLDYKLCLRVKNIDLYRFCFGVGVGDVNKCRSTTSYVFIQGDDGISWKCK